MSMSLNVADVMSQSGVAFGTSGARGLVSDMTDEVCFLYTCAFLQHLGSLGQFEAGRPVALAGDLRPSTPRIMAACAAAIRHMGGVDLNCGFVPSPAVAGFGFGRGIPSLMVTGSHIPADRNGIKFNRVDGEVLKEDEQAIKSQVVHIPSLFDDAGALLAAPELGSVVDVATAYITRYVDAFGADSLSGMRLGVYQHSAVGRDILTDLVQALGGEVVALGRSDQFVPVDTEAVRRQDQDLALEWAKEHQLDAILSTDGDSDRPLLADERGIWLRGDILGILCAAALSIDTVCAPVSCNTALEASELFEVVSRTRIGSPYVIERMNSFVRAGSSKVCGFEANGGFLLATRVSFADGRLLPPLPTRDAVLPMIGVLHAARQRGLSLSQIVQTLPGRFTFSDRLERYATERSRALLDSLKDDSGDYAMAKMTRMFGHLSGEAQHLDATDGVRTTFSRGDVIHLRPSGNAPELRCYTESDTNERAEWLGRQVLASIAALADGP